MPLVEAWQCPRTGHLFTDKSKYLSHLHELAKTNIEHRRVEKQKSLLDARLIEFRNSVYSLRDLISFIENEGDFLRDLYNYSDWDELESVKLKVHKASLHFTHHLNNTHHAPIGGVTNWGSKKDKPTGYPGFHGKIDVRISIKDKKGRHSSFAEFKILEFLHIYHSYGNGRDKNVYNMGFDLFKSDFPNLYEVGSYEYNSKTKKINYQMELA